MYSLGDRIAKRFLDVAASACGLVVLSPVLAATGVLVKISSPGPVLFRQQRVGRRKQLFSLFKFRTMRTDTMGLSITADGDRRITPIGRILRKTKLDELPGLLNVLLGHMSLVGPRPEVPDYVDGHYAEAWDRVFEVRPGITDPATIEFRNEEDLLATADDPERMYVEEILPHKVSMQLRYIDEASFARDIRVLFETLFVIVYKLRT